MKGTLNLFLLITCCLFGKTYGQTMIQGRVYDAKDQQKLTDATVMLITSKDSILTAFTRSDQAGKFSLKKPDTGSYRLIVSYPKYGDFYTDINTGQNYSDLPVGLTNSATLLEEVMVTGRIPITIKGDTTEYDAGSFKVEKNAKVEDLLKVLPGITVDASGKITAQGKAVKKVLVDGEEFFGDDPTLVTRNIRSDMVDKVQVYEKKSEQAERTGVDDGEREQTINVKLKEGAKNGVFGKALGGGGTDDYYMGQVMVNKFKGSQKISAYGLFGNNGTTSMNWEDAQKYGGDSGVSYGDDGSTYWTSYTDPFSGQGVVGIPRAINTGITFLDKFDKNKHNVNLSYKYGRISSDGDDETIMSGLINSNTVKTVNTENDQHRVNLKYDLNFDSLNVLTIKGDASRKNLWSNNEREAYQFSSNQDTTVSENTREIVDNAVKGFNLNTLFTHKFKKNGRSLTFDALLRKEETSGSGSLYSKVRNYSTQVDSITDQQKNRLQNTSAQRVSLTYTEPLTKTLNLSLGGGIEHSKNASLVESFNKSEGGNYDELDSLYSNNYDFDRNSSNYKVALTYRTEKIRFNLTNSFNNDKLEQYNNYTQNGFSRSFFTYNPSVGGGYNFTKNKNMWFNYNGRNQLPALNQIQPILDNSDQLNRYLGNENLKPSFTNSVNLGYNSFKLLTQSYFYVGGYASFTKDPIAQNITIVNTTDPSNPELQSIYNLYEWNNITGKTNTAANFWAGHYFKLSKDLGLGNSPQINMSLSENYNFFNGELNKVNTMDYSFTYNLIRDTKTGFNFNVDLSPKYRVMKSSVESTTNSNGFVFGSSGSVEYFFNKTLKIYSNFNYTYEAPTKAFDEKFEQFLVHPGISKKFLKDESLVIDFMVNDVLNQNKGFSRSASTSVFTQRRYDTIRRYYMLKLSWDFTKMFL